MTDPVLPRLTRVERSCSLITQATVERWKAVPPVRVEKVGAGILGMVVIGESDPDVVRRRMRLRRGEWAAASYWALGAFRRAVEHPQQRADLTQVNDELLERQRMMRSRNAIPSPIA